jgi:high-affinity iron transporter
MFETTLITFREGLEMFLIIAIMLAYLAKTGRAHLFSPVYWGVAAAVLISLTTGWHIAELAEDPYMEGGLAIVAGIMVASFTWMMMKNAKNIRQHITAGIDRQAERAGKGAFVGVFIFTVLMIAREGMETAMMLGSLSGTINAGDMLFGAIMGFASVGVIGYLWIKQSASINLKVFMQVTGIFLMLFCVHLFMYGFHELTEVNAVPFIDNFYWHNLTEPFEPGEFIGNLMTAGLLVVPAGWIIFNYFRHRLYAPENSAAE